MSLEIIIDSSFFYAVGIVQTARQKDVKKGSYKSKIKVLGARQSKTAFEHVENLIPDIYNILQKNNLSIKEINSIRVGIGPGPFTGLRSGIAAGLGISQGLGCEISGFSSLLVYALASGEKEVIVVNHARRGQVYWGHFIKENQALNQVDQKFIADGVSANSYKQLNVDISPLSEIFDILQKPEIVQLGNINLNKSYKTKCYKKISYKKTSVKDFLKMSVLAPKASLEPLYLRPPDIN
ncbi:MAG: tRNA (adenosine(37)-N6)-threonylcarbamoyltransferase complex dimerization subunit type 1 TsaB [Bifidobacteriaceae bacterium]|jgi:tRNA threonylcarbamoyl adenosine modification protein YeaZ|nr:tRNA (adenosine(37)-N6)-threonylcarbamoyltransferase complex dimerization subunit type 1 TsaB [Bifidobacteriaceae bacterium]